MSVVLPFTAKHQGAHVERRHTGVAHTGAFVVVLNDARDIVIAGNGVSAVACEGLRATSSMAWARFAGTRLIRASFVKGKELEVEDQFSLRSATTVRHCVLQFNPDQLAITVEGTDNFTLRVMGGWQRLVLNGANFILKPEHRQVSFTNDAGHWKMVGVKE